MNQEERSALSQDWGRFLKYAIPEIPWMPIPNVGPQVTEWVDHWGIDGLILTGGEDIGTVPIRDETEFALLDHFVNRELSVFGVCRGLQLIVLRNGVNLERCSPHHPIATSHAISFAHRFLGGYELPEQADVNSYHEWGVPRSQIPKGYAPLALDENGWAEALMSNDFSVVALMWHPERHKPFKLWDRQLLRWTLGLMFS